MRTSGTRPGREARAAPEAGQARAAGRNRWSEAVWREVRAGGASVQQVWGAAGDTDYGAGTHEIAQSRAGVAQRARAYWRHRLRRRDA